MKAKTKKQLAIAQQYCFDLIVANGLAMISSLLQ